MEKGNKKLYVQIAIFVVVFAMAFLGTRYVMSEFKSKASNEINESKNK